MNSFCPCGSQQPYLDCCGLYIEQGQAAPTPEKLMRSRYTAYTEANIAYIRATMSGKPLINFDDVEAENWAKRVKWLGLEIINTYPEVKQDDCKFVEFIASYELDGKTQSIHEKSEFRKFNNQWFYTDSLKPNKLRKANISRNKPCPCGSNKKYKNCHGRES
ncbi:YchJ family protein [Legionella gresilensis]|uniref:YchJ family protein n=1 Tax=Legionella gresilensis TaxID=91823 RepID=UPI00104161CB|nr:YchJ family protein [Legionella gresilensis]